MTLLWGYFVIREQGHAKIYQCTTFEVSSFAIYTLMAGAQNLKFGPWTPLRPFWGYFGIHVMGHAKVYMCTKFEVYSLTLSKLWRVSKIQKFGP